LTALAFGFFFVEMSFSSLLSFSQLISSSQLFSSLDQNLLQNWISAPEPKVFDFEVFVGRNFKQRQKREESSQDS
jgi:hypothetical protein